MIWTLINLVALLSVTIGLHNQLKKISKRERKIMATLAELNESVAALQTKADETVTKIAELKAAQGAATEAELDGVKAGIDGAVAKLNGAING